LQKDDINRPFFPQIPDAERVVSTIDGAMFTTHRLTNARDLIQQMRDRPALSLAGLYH
jgi:hypothetical protein